MDYKISGRKLKTQSFQINFDYNISEVILFDNIYIVLLSLTDDNGKMIGDVDDNIYGVSSSGIILWRIEDPSNVYHTEGTDAFTGINQNSDGSFSAITFSAMKYVFDYKTGKLISRQSVGW